jgi:uncharacterized protein HemX
MEEHGSAGPADGEGLAHAQERTTPGTYLTPYPSEPEADHRSRAVTAALLATALVVALGAGGAVYGVLADEGPAVTPTAPSASP